MIKQIALALGLTLGLTLGLFGLLGGQQQMAQADPGTLYVAPGGNCGGATPCYASIQAAVDAAAAGDVIKIAAGTYSDIHRRADVLFPTLTISQVVYITNRGGPLRR